MKKAEKKKSTLLLILKRMILLHPWLVGLTLLGILVSSAASITASFVIQQVLDGLSSIGATGQQAVSPAVFDAFVRDVLVPNMTFMGISYAVGNLSMVACAIAMSYVGQDFMNHLRKEIFDHMEDLPLRYFDSHEKGDIMSVYTNDVDTIRQFVIQTFQAIFTCSLTFLVIVGMMLAFSVYLTAIFAVGIALMFFASYRLGKRSEKHFIDQQKAIGAQEGLIEEMMGGLKVVKSFNHEEKAKLQFDERNQRLMESSYKANAVSGSIAPVIINIGYLFYVGIIVIGIVAFAFRLGNYGFMTGLGVMTLGTTVGFDPLVQQAIGLIQEVGQQFGFIAQAGAGANRVLALLSQTKEADEGYVELVQGRWVDGSFQENPRPAPRDDWAWRHPHRADGTATYAPVKGDIRMFDVDFSYEPGKVVLHNIDLYAKPGQKVAFVGSTGAGKTTITNLLNRFYDIADGKIRYDGININKIKKKDLRRSLGMVLQDTSLFSGTIMENIRFGRLDATDEECVAAAKLSNADSFIQSLPDGYQTVIEGDGSSLSQGQCQLLSIARVAVADPPVLILDEATSSIDARTESIVTAGMDKLMEGRTVFAIAHRLSTVRNADVIMVLDHGRIVERGTHDQLVALKGMYYQLYTGRTELS